MNQGLYLCSRPARDYSSRTSAPRRLSKPGSPTDPSSIQKVSVSAQTLSFPGGVPQKLHSGSGSNSGTASRNPALNNKHKGQSAPARHKCHRSGTTGGYGSSSVQVSTWSQKLPTGNPDEDRSSSAKVVKVATFQVPPSGGPAEGLGVMTHIPSPPIGAKPQLGHRPSSAQRFRKMVLECRDPT